MAKYHLAKQTRIYCGEGYSGHSSREVLDILGPVETDSLEKAKEWRDKLQEFNPVGWNIWDSETGNLVDGVDHFA